MARLQLPLVDSTASPRQVSSDFYYRIPVRTIYKNYPVYAPGKEPAGYIWNGSNNRSRSLRLTQAR